MILPKLWVGVGWEGGKNEFPEKGKLKAIKKR